MITAQNDEKQQLQIHVVNLGQDMGWDHAVLPATRQVTFTPAGQSGTRLLTP